MVKTQVSHASKNESPSKATYIRMAAAIFWPVARCNVLVVKPVSYVCCVPKNFEILKKTVLLLCDFFI